MKYTITENRLKNIIKESVSKLLREYDEEELDYDKREFIKAMQNLVAIISKHQVMIDSKPVIL